MKPIELIIFVLALSESECRFPIFKETSDNSAEWLMKSAVTTLLSCYEEVNTVGAAGITEPSLLKLLKSNESRPLIVFSDNLSSGQVYKASPHKLQLFVVEVSSRSPKQIHRLLRRLVKSQHSANVATYLIIDWPSQQSQKGCSNAPQYLLKAWNWDLLNAFYVCLDSLERIVFVYSYNPYTSRAPAPWKRLEKTYRSGNGHLWSLFVREYHPGNQEICKNLIFVKDHDLGGYPIRTLFPTVLTPSEWTTNHTQIFLNYQASMFAQCILKTLNATPELYMFNDMTNSGRLIVWSPTKNITYRFGKFYDWDIGFSYVLSQGQSSVHEISSVVKLSGLGVMTQYSGNMSQLAKLIAVLDRSSRLGLCLVVFITLLFFKYFMRQPLGSAMLNVVRIIANSSLEKAPGKTAPRLYLAGVFICVVTIVGIYQGLLAALLTKQTPLPDIETMEDLMESPHKIYTGAGHAHFFVDPKFNGRVVFVRLEECYLKVLQDSLAACVGDQDILVLIGEISAELHVSKDVIIPSIYFYPIRNNWNLKKRLNEIIESFSESHIDWYLSGRTIEWKSEAIKYKKNLERSRPSKIKLSDLGFAFAFLGIGLSLATVAFIVEVAMKRA